MLERINETTEFLRGKGIIDPDAGIILGTGLGELTSKIENRIEIDYKDIPNFPGGHCRRACRQTYLW